jgi:hypothetical protein
MKTYGGVDVYIHVFLTSALVGGEWSASRPGHFNCIGGWVGHRAGLDDMEKILDPTSTQNRPLGLPARSQSLYRTALSRLLQILHKLYQIKLIYSFDFRRVWDWSVVMHEYY